MNTEQRLAREGPVELIAQQPVERASAERSDGQSPHALSTKRLLEPRGPRPFHESAGEQKEHLVPVEPPKRECERTRRGRVEPLDVVDGNEERLPLAQCLEHAADRHAQCAAIDRLIRRVLDEQGNLERMSPRRRERRQHVVDGALEQISQPRVSEAVLGLGRSRREDAQSSRPRMLDAGKPDRRLPNAGLALEHERAGPSLRLADEGVYGAELLFPADDPEDHLSRNDREQRSRRRQPKCEARALRELGFRHF